MPTLVIIDMQEKFKTPNNPRTIAACEREIEYAINNGYYIVFLEYQGYGPTLPVLVEKTKNYNLVSFISKNFNDGGQEVFNEIKHNSQFLCEIRVCGVNASACVNETVITLNKLLESTSIVLVADAINCNLSKQQPEVDTEEHIRMMVKTLKYISYYNERIVIANQEHLPFLNKSA